jgi:hypothetical protein
MGSPNYLSAMNLTQSGTQFLGALATGQLTSSLNTIGMLNASLQQPIRSLLAMLTPAQPMFQSMANGNFQKALSVLHSNEQTHRSAENFGKLELLADLVQPGWQKTFETYQNMLAQVLNIPKQLDQIRALEKSAQQLERQFGKDFAALAKSMIEGSEVLRQKQTSVRSQRVEYPGVNLQEIATGMRSIPGVSTSSSSIGGTAAKLGASLIKGESALEARLRQAELQNKASEQNPKPGPKPGEGS